MEEEIEKIMSWLQSEIDLEDPIHFGQNEMDSMKTHLENLWRKAEMSGFNRHGSYTSDYNMDL